MTEQKIISLGKISGIFGVNGRVKVFSYTDPRENILQYSPWILQRNGQQKEINVIGGNRQGKTLVAQLQGIESREAAQLLNGWEIVINASQLPEPGADEYYWVDLVGLQVETKDGEQLGVVDYLLETGANDVLVVKSDRERLIPFIQGQTVLNIDLAAGRMVVEWDPEF